MGGTLILSSIFLSVILWGDLENRYLWVAFLTSIALGYWVGLMIVSKSNLNLAMVYRQRTKFLAINYHIYCLFIFVLQSGEHCRTSLIVPFFKDISIPLGVGFIFLSYLVVIGTSNAVNLTDGLDGLAILPCVMVAAGLGVIGYLAGNAIYSDFLNIPFIPGAGEMIVFCGALVGSGIGFLWFNTPAQVFMGDVGSLSLGAALGIVTVIIRHEYVLLVMGGLFVMEALSVIVQVASFKLTGKRVFNMAPFIIIMSLKVGQNQGSLLGFGLSPSCLFYLG